MKTARRIDSLIQTSLISLAADPHVRQWRAKEDNWVSYFAFKHLLACCRPGSIIADPAQIAIEVSVPQPAGYKTRGVDRDLVIWPDAGMTCWDNEWNPSCHPLAILEWKVQRKGHRNPFVGRDRKWLKAYCCWQPTVVGYAIEVETGRHPPTITCWRFLGRDVKRDWLTLQCQ
jgi:hypothetical protein